jgi:hypothetical protein
MGRLRFVEPPILTDYEGQWQKCTGGCGRRLPHTKDFFHVHSVKEYRYLRPECKMCRNKTHREYLDKKKGLIKFINFRETLETALYVEETP